jgi:hypothetical protein
MKRFTAGGPLTIVVLAAGLVAGCGGSGTSTSTTASSSVARTPPAQEQGSEAAVKRVAVPKLVGERFGKAVRDVERVGLQQHAPAFTGTVGNPHYNGKCKKILSQSPPAGTKLPKGATVSIVYGVCPHAIAHAHPSLKKHG